MISVSQKLDLFVENLSRRKKSLQIQHDESIPDGLDINETVKWLKKLVDDEYDERETHFSTTFSLDSLISTVLYISGTIYDLNKSSQVLLEKFLIDIKYFINSAAKKVPMQNYIINKFKSGLKSGLGNSYNSIKYISEYLDINIDYKFQENFQQYVIFCITLEKKEYIVVDYNFELLSILDPFVRLYQHYKKNPLYIFSDFSVKSLNGNFLVLFAISSLSDTETKRIFTGGIQNKKLYLILSSDIQDYINNKQETPEQYKKIIELFNTKGTVSYTFSSLKDKKTNVFENVFLKTIETQKKLKMQSDISRELMSYSTQLLNTIISKNNLSIQMYKKSSISSKDFFDTIHNNKTCSNKTLKYCLCKNVSTSYQVEKYTDFTSKNFKKEMYYFQVYINSDSTPLAILFAQERMIEKNDVLEPLEINIQLFCKNTNVKNNVAARYLLPVALEYFRQNYEFCSLEAVPYATPLYEAYGFIKTPNRDDWILPLEQSRSTRRLYDSAELFDKRKM